MQGSGLLLIKLINRCFRYKLAKMPNLSLNILFLILLPDLFIGGKCVVSLIKSLYSILPYVNETLVCFVLLAVDFGFPAGFCNLFFGHVRA